MIAKAEGGGWKAEKGGPRLRAFRLLPSALRLCILVVLAKPLGAATVTTFDDIRFWIGEGVNRAAIAIDWEGDSADDAALVWGYRWDGVATGEQMLRAVVAADARLFARTNGGGQFGIAVYGVGYDKNNSGGFAIDDVSVSFDAEGFAITGPADGSLALDPVDRYAEGWEDGYWHYGWAFESSGESGGAVDWASSRSGPSGRTLTNGEWNSYAFAVTFNFDEFAENLNAAEPPSPLPGDYNGDGHVDVADYTVWRDTLGDIASYLVWRDHFGETLPAPLKQGSLTIPEPASAALLLFGSTLLARPARRAGHERRRRRRRRLSSTFWSTT